jgi:hypothetical protein
MMIRDIERPFAPRARAKDANPLRKTAEGLGLFLDRLSEAVREQQSEPEGDSVDSELRSHARGRNQSRYFKLASPQDGPAPPLNLNLTEEQSAALGALREARSLAAEASNLIMPTPDRQAAQERLQTLFNDLSAKRIGILASVSGSPSESGGTLFSLITPESAKRAYNEIDEMIMKFLDAGEAGSASNADAAYIDHQAALSASEQVRDFLLGEGPAKAFSRFREINRSNILGLLQ